MGGDRRGEGTVEGANSFARYAAHAAVGCASGEASGSGCGQGAFSAVVGKFASNTWGDAPGKFSIGGLTASVIAGGTASVIGGGKFGNGAITAAFGYLFNAAAAQLLKGSGHHVATNDIARVYPWSDAALKVFDLPENRIAVENHKYDRAFPDKPIDPKTNPSHGMYNEGVRDITKAQINGGLNPATATATQAQNYVNSIKNSSDPRLRVYNNALYSRAANEAMMNAMRRSRSARGE